MTGLKNWTPAVFVAIFIFWLSSLPGTTIREAGLGSEGIHVNGHFLLFFVLYFTLYKATKKIWVAAILAFVYGLTDEYHQTFVVGREASLKDIVTDTVGIFLGVLMIWRFDSLLPKILKNWLRS